MGEVSLRRSALAAIALSTASIVACLLLFPMLFTFVLRQRAMADAELEW